MSIDIESLQKRIDEIYSQLRWMYEELQELESERAELEDYKSTLLEFPIDDPCPECGTQLKDKLSGGVYCPSCGYWFCF